MNKKHLTWLGVALVVLIGLKYAVNREGTRVTADLSEAGVSRLIPEGFKQDDVMSIDVRGPGAEESLRAVRGEAGWVIDSAHGAPADEEAVTAFLDIVLDLAGELRAEDPALHEEFGLGEESALRLELTRGSGGEPVVLLLGKSGDQPTSQFVRLAGKNAVRHVSTGLRNTLGLFGDTKSPKLDHWVDKQVLDLEQDAIASVEFVRQDMSWALRSQGPVPEGMPVPGAAGATAPEERTWSVEAPGFGWDEQSWGASGLASRLARLRVNSVLDSESSACSFPASAPRLFVTMEDGARHELRFGNERTADGEVPLRVGTDGPCYGLTKWSAQSLLPRASQLFDLPPALTDAPDATDVTSVTLQHEGETVRAVREGKGEEEQSWVLRQPAGAADSAAVDRLVNSVLNLKYEDLAVTEQLAATAKEVHASVTLETGSSLFEVSVLGERGGTGGERYVIVKGGESAPEGYSWLLSESTLKSLLVSPSQLRGADPT